MENRRGFGKGKCLALSLALNAGIMLLFRFCMLPVFETNDDTAIMGIVNGIRGSMDIHVIQNTLLGMLYRSLYTITCRISWYSVCQYAFLMLGFGAICYVLLQRAGKMQGLCLWLAIMSFFAPQCYGMMQYTKAAGVLTVAGLFLLLHACSQEAGTGGVVAEGTAGAVLALAGSMYRFDEFLSAGALMSGIGLWILLSPTAGVASRATVPAPARNREETDGQLSKPSWIRYSAWKRKAAALAVCLMVVAAAWMLRKADQRYYASDERWSAYREYNDLRAQLQDYGFPDYEENRETYERLDINEDAFDLYSGWNQFDPDKLGILQMRELVALKEKRKMDLQLAKDYLREIPSFFLSNRMCWCLFLVLILCIFAAACARALRQLPLWVVLMWQSVLFLLLYFYLFYKGRYTMDRIAVGYWLAMILTASWIFADYAHALFETQSLRPALTVGALALGFYSSNWVAALPAARQYTIDKRRWNRQILEQMSQDPEHLYLRKAGLLVTDDCYGPFDPQPFATQANMGLLGGWICSVPVQQDVLAAYGVTNPYRDMIDHEQVLLVDNQIELTLRYLREYYAPDARAEEVQSFGTMKVYRIVTGDDAG